MRILTIILLLLNITSQSSAQLDLRKGYDLFKATNYIDALPELKKLVKINPKDRKALYHIALCYLRTDNDKAASVRYLEKAISLGKTKKETQYYLALGYLHNYNFEKAEKAFKLYLKSKGKFKDEAKAQLANIPTAKKLYDSPLSVEFINLGDKINSSYPDYAPFISNNEQILVFTSRREEGKGRKEFDGYYPSDIFTSNFNGFTFSSVKPAGVNTNFDESCVGINPDGSTILLYFDNIRESGEIYESKLVGKTYNKKIKIKKGINHPKTMETSGSISPDGNIMFFASNREGDKGGLDLYMTVKLPNGLWAESQPLSKLNTTGHEDFPTLSPDGKTLYFSSNGRGGLGGYDLFKVDFNREDLSFGEIINIGYPLNTSYDDKVICFAENEKHAYVSQYRKGEGLGNLDIYRVNFKQVDLNPSLYSVSIQGTVGIENVKDASISVYDEYQTNIGEFKSSDSNNIILTLNPGTYSLEIEAPGYKKTLKDIKVSEFDYNKGIIKLSYRLNR